MKARWDVVGWMKGCLYLSDVFALHLGPLNLPFVSEYGEERIRNNLGQAEAPDERDGIEEVGVAGTCVYPEVVEGGAK